MAIPPTLIALNSRPLPYEDRITVFFDILGWRSLIEAAGSNPALVSAIALIPRMFARLARDHNTEGSSGAGSRITTFSDSVVFSAPYVAEEFAARLNGLAEVQFGLLTIGMCLRGGITVGPLVHDDLLLFGPAMNRAYHLESQLAVVPRLLLDPDLPRDIRTAAESAIAIDEMDGLAYVNPFNRTVFDAGRSRRHSPELQAGLSVHFPDATDEPAQLNYEMTLYAVRHMAELARSQETAPSIHAKYDWLLAKIANAQRPL